MLTSDNTTIDYVSMNYYARAVLASEWIPSWGNATGGSIEVIRRSGAGARLRTDWLDGRVSLERLSQ